MARKKKDNEKKREVSGEVTGKGGEGLSAIVRISEEVNVEQDHDANIKSIAFTGTLGVENPSTVDRLWDINVTFADVEGISLDSNEIKIQELGITEEDNVDSRAVSYTHLTLPTILLV